MDWTGQLDWSVLLDWTVGVNCWNGLDWTVELCWLSTVPVNSKKTIFEFTVASTVQQVVQEFNIELSGIELLQSEPFI